MPSTDTLRRLANLERSNAARVNSTAEERRASTAAMRAAREEQLRAQLLAEIDPDGTLPEREREARYANARSAHFARIGRLGVQARRARQAAATAEKALRDAVADPVDLDIADDLVRDLEAR